MGKWPRLDKIEMIDGPIDKQSYEHQIKKLQDRLTELHVHDLRTGGRVLICIDGWDAAGKGGMIERLVAGLEPKSVQVWRIGAPTPEEQGRHYLWRFWDRLPGPGNWAIFDRTWYGRVLVERVEGFCDKATWKRAYREINGLRARLASEPGTPAMIGQSPAMKRALDQIRQVSNRCKIDPMRGQTSQRMNGNVEGEITPTQLVLLSPPVIAPSFDG